MLCDKVLQKTLLVSQFRISNFIYLHFLTVDTLTKLLHHSNKAHKSVHVYRKGPDTFIAKSGSVNFEPVKTWLFVRWLKRES